MEQIAKALSAKAAKTKKKKRKVSFMSKVDDSDNSSSSESESYMSFNKQIQNSNCFIPSTLLNKKKMTEISNSKINNNKEIQWNYAIRSILSNNGPSKQPSTRPTTEMVVEVISPKGTTRPIRCLLDTGTTRSIVLMDMVTLSQVVTQRKATTWQTMSGSLVTNKIAQLVFKLPELST